MKATDLLRAEHENIKLLLRIMDRISLHIEKKDSFEIADLEKCIKIIKIYAGENHLRKEEDILFATLIKSGFHKNQGPVAVLRHEHEVAKEYVNDLIESIEYYKSGDNLYKEDIISNIRAYVKLIGEHINKEKNILFMMADQKLTDEEQDITLKALENMEKENFSNEKSIEIQELIKQLGIKYLG
ncbi:MAG: hemerythrin domain-containing protein [Bacteroidota bacterium]|nr:hemerythrin domain-containing protein [Bacteroidota bacterium]